MKTYDQFIQAIIEGSYDFKDFKDPWAVMSPEDRKEAYRLTKLIFKVMPASPKQKELQAKRDAIFKKYKIGEAASIRWMKPEPIKVQGPNGKYYTRSKGEYTIKSQDGRFTIKKIAGYYGSFIYQLFDKKYPDGPWLNLDSIKDAKDQAKDQL